MFEESYAWDDPEKALQSQPFLQYEEGGSLSSIWGVRSLGINPADGQEVFFESRGTSDEKLECIRSGGAGYVRTDCTGNVRF